MRLIYVDESGTSESEYLIIGSVWGTEEQFQDFENKARPILDTYFPNGRELKWRKVSKAKMAGYIGLLDVFLFQSGLQFRCLKIEKSKLKHGKFNGGDQELGYYKFLFELISCNIKKDARYSGIKDVYIIYHDIVSRKVKQETRLSDLKRILNNDLMAYSVKSKAPLRDIQPLDSKDTIRIQLVDLLTGAIRYASDSSVKKVGPKQEMVAFLESGIKCSISGSTPFLMSKINIWNLRLQ